MAVRFYGDFQNDVGDQFRVNIHDTQFSFAPSELTLSVPGFTLTYEGNNQEQYQPLIPSKLEFTFYNEGGDFDTWLNTVVPAATEAQFLVEVLTNPNEIDEALWWRGVLLPEQVQQNDEPTPTAVSFVASDDLAQLKESTWDDLNLSAYTIADAIHAILSLVRCKSLYSDNDLFLRYMNDIVPEDYTGSNYLNGGSMIAPTIPGEDPVAYYNCYDILRSIAITFNARVFQAQGVWYFMPLNKLQQRSDGDSFTGDLYAMEADGDDATWTALEKIEFVSSMLKINGTDIEKMAGNIIEYSRPTKRVDRIRITKANEYLFQENTGFTTLSGATNDIEFADDDRTYFAGSTHLITVNYNLDIASSASENNFVNLHTVRCDLTIKFGDQYYTNDGWSGTAGVKSTVIGTYYKSFGFEEISQFSVQVPELVNDEVGLDVTLNTVVFNGAGVDITGSLPTNDALHILRIYAGDSANNLGDSVTFSSQTTIDNQVTLTQSDVVTGTVALSYGVGLDNVQYGSGSYFLGGVDHETWTSSQTSTGYSLNRLGVREIMYNTQLPHRIRNGAFYIPSGFIWPYNLLRENGDDHGIHQLTYTANASEVTMERWQLNQDTTNLEFRTDQVGTDNPRDRFVPNGINVLDRLSVDLNDQATGSRPQFRNVIEIDGSVGSTHEIDQDCTDGFMYTLEWVDGATGFSRIILPKVEVNEGRLLRFKTNDTVAANKYFKISPTVGDYAAGTRIDGEDSFELDRDYDGIMVLCHNYQWYVIQRKSKSKGGGVDVQYHGRYDTEAETLRSGATGDVEFYYTARPDGDGTAENETSDVGETDTINRTLAYSTKHQADPDTAADWTDYTTQPADNASFATAKAALLAGLNETDATAETRGTLPVSLKMTRTTTPVTNLLLDDYPAEFAVSVRKLDKDYTGSCMRVRRASDNSEQDIGFDSNGDLDTAAIATHCGTANGYVVTWYNQAGSNNATQSTQNDQPQIYNGSTQAVFTENGKPIIKNSNTYLSRNALNFSINFTNDSWLFAVCLVDYTFSAILQGDGAGDFVALAQSGVTTSCNGGASNVVLYKNGASWSATTRDDVYDDLINNHSLIAADFDASWTSGKIGYQSSSNVDVHPVQEFIIWTNDQSSNRTSIETNINDYFSIY